MTIFKFPNQEQFYTLNRDFPEFHFSFYSFEGEEQIRLQGKVEEISMKEILKMNFSLPKAEIKEPLDESKEEYLDKISRTIACIKENRLDKLVVARKKNLYFEKIDFAKSFLNLCEKYPSSFVYAFSENGVSWMGAFAEVLGHYNKTTQEFVTMSLAGTLPIDEEWTEKEMSEQQPVTDYIVNILKRYSEKIELSERYDHISGNIKHLRTDIKIKLAPEKVDEVLSQLHPTPAVGGSPKAFCIEKIHELEGFSREIYAGYSRIETGDQIACYITLRCGKFYDNRVELYGGGGITAMSNPEKEWRETELKMQALGNSLIF